VNLNLGPAQREETHSRRIFRRLGFMTPVRSAEDYQTLKVVDTEPVIKHGHQTGSTIRVFLDCDLNQSGTCATRVLQ
jgi:hypothetical protein